MRSRMKNVEKRLVQPPNSTGEGVWAPNRTLNTAAARAIATGSKSATAYHTGATRQRIIRRSNPTIPVLPWVIPSTTSAARKGPKPTIGWGERSRAYRIEGHHERAQASTKNAMSGYLLNNDIECSPF